MYIAYYNYREFIFGVIMTFKKTLTTISASTVLLALSIPAHAAVSWTFDSSPTNTGTPSGTSVTATASAWTTQTTNINSGLRTASLRQYSGLGVQSSVMTAAAHSML